MSQDNSSNKAGFHDASHDDAARRRALAQNQSSPSQPTHADAPASAMPAIVSRVPPTSAPLANATSAAGPAPIAAYAGADVAAYELVQAIMARQARRRGLFQAILFGSTIFACGAASGWGLGLLRTPPAAPVAATSPSTMTQYPSQNPQQNEGPPSNELPPRQPPVDQLVDHLRHELQLTDAQSRQIMDIYQRCFSALQAIRVQSMQPRYEQMRQEVQKVLTPEQFARWDERFHAMENQVFSPPRRRPPPPRDEDEGPPPDRQ